MTFEGFLYHAPDGTVVRDVPQPPELREHDYSPISVVPVRVPRARVVRAPRWRRLLAWWRAQPRCEDPEVRP